MNVLNILLEDYSQRNAGLRRQKDHYLTALGIVSGATFGLLGWALGSPEDERLTWAIPLTVAIVNTALLTTLFVFYVVGMMSGYINEIELAINRTLERDQPEIGRRYKFGFNAWRRSVNVRAANRATMLVLVFLIGLGMVETALLVFGQNLGDVAGGYRWLQGVGIIAVPFLIGAYWYCAIRRQNVAALSRMQGEATALNSLLDANDLEQLLVCDFKERNEDIRRLFNYYTSFLLAGAASISTLIGVYLGGENRNWIFVLFPPVILGFMAALLSTYTVARQTKACLTVIEDILNEIATRNETGIHERNSEARSGGFVLGFFSQIRNQKIQSIESKRMPIQLFFINVAVITIMLSVMLPLTYAGMCWLWQIEFWGGLLGVFFGAGVAIALITMVIIYFKSNVVLQQVQRVKFSNK